MQQKQGYGKQALCLCSAEGPPVAAVISCKLIEIMQNIRGDNHLPTGPYGPLLACNWRSCSHTTAHLANSLEVNASPGAEMICAYLFNFFTVLNVFHPGLRLGQWYSTCSRPCAVCVCVCVYFSRLTLRHRRQIH